MNKKILYSLIGLLSFTDAVNSAVYQCKPCPVGTYSDGTKLSCLECPEGFVCPAGTGTPIPIENCSKVLANTYGSGSGTKDIFMGTYLIEIAGGGGGGGGSDGDGNRWHCTHAHGGTGGRGDKKEVVVYVDSDMTYTYKVGGGGSGGSKSGNGGKGGTSEFALSDKSATISAEGGEGGGRGYAGYANGSTGKDAGNGLGGSGGGGGYKSKPCHRNGGGGGGAGWIKVYQLGNCKL